MSGFAYVVKDGKVEQPTMRAALGQNGGLTWIHLTTNDERAQLWLGGEAQLSQYVIDALTATETRPRCDAVGEGAVINLRGLSSEATTASDPLASIRIYAMGGCVFSVTRKHLSALQSVRDEVESHKILDPGDLIAAIASAITEELDPVVAELGDSLDDCEEQISGHRAFELRRMVNKVRVQAIGYRRFLNPQRAAIEKLAGLPGEWLREDDRLHLAAAADRAARMAEEVESIRERAALTHETLTDLRGELLDQRSLVIAIVAMVFLPLTFLTGLLGMNVDGIPWAHEPWAFWGVVAVCLTMALGIAGYFAHRHWFE
ncbi:zinc transporter ZntB [Sphingomonas sp. ABOLD]|uniref:Zinc transporter n=1 Tax=Sphingomonas trueperi TaxID=53317 RepID=A0A7X5XYP6_9SPHN|nr:MULTISPECIES: CorA family divalent cation transporter [Sphingomonas]NJB96261.1 zinc transporter [Sphingomonas trueperi]RSV32894.1 zinc transporter ZntB [Sphingomonas sp. ABOLE]RSV36727.1 zinc transporter ZntB [Sphingomonas sp. ABOLD]